MKQWFPYSKLSPQQKSERMAKRVRNNLGVIDVTQKQKTQVYRDSKLEMLDSYYESRQYDHLAPWDTKPAEGCAPLGLYQKQPKFKFPFARNLSSRITSKLFGDDVFPKLLIVDSPDDQAFIRAVVDAAELKSKILEPTRRTINTGSVFIRFKITGGAYKISWFKSKYCYPVFQDNGELESIVIKYVFEDPSETDDEGKPKKKWYKLELTTSKETLYDNPPFSAESDREPEFQVVDEFVHNFGFVQGEWWKSTEDDDSPDGYGLISDITDFIDELCYSLSQSSKSVAYNQDPQLAFKGVNDDEVAQLIRSVTKSWNLGPNGDAKYLEAGLGGVEKAIALRDKVIQNIGDLTRATIQDPEKLVGAAQSAKAMEILNGPLMDLVSEYRNVFEKQFRKLVLKLAWATLLSKSLGIDIPIEVPDSYIPATWDLTLKWPRIFKLTLDDIQKMVNLANTAASGNLIARKTGTRYLAEEFGIEDIDAEQDEIAKQPVFNPFGSF